MSAGTDLGRMLATVPIPQPDGSGPFPSDFYYANIRQQLSNYGFTGITSRAAIPEEKREVFQRAISALTLMEEATLLRPEVTEEQWRATVGYDFWQVDRSLGWSLYQWTRLEGRFDRDQIARAMVASGRTPTQYQGETIYAYGPDGSTFDENDPIWKGLNIDTRFRRVTLEAAALTSHRVTRHAEAVIDVRDGRLPSMLTVPDYDALAYALDPAVSAIIALPSKTYENHAGDGTDIPPGTPVSRADRMPRYNLVGAGLLDDGKTHAMIFALVYEQAADAQVAALLLRRRLANYNSYVYKGRKLWEPEAVGEPRFVTARSRSVVVQPVAIAQDGFLSTWQNMMLQADFGFLKEYWNN